MIGFIGLFWDLPEGLSQYKNEKDAKIPLESFYIERKGGGFRKLYSKLNFGLSTGFGKTSVSHQLNGYGIFQDPNVAPTLFYGNTVGTGYSNWFNAVTPVTNTQTAQSVIVNSDVGKMGFKSKGYNIPIKATLHVEILKRFRLGGGYSYEFMFLSPFKPFGSAVQVSSFASPVGTAKIQKYFGLIGGSVYRYYEYLLVVDAQIGAFKLSRNFDRATMKKGVMINLGLTAEREMSEYFKLFIRPSYELKGFKRLMPEATISHRLNGFYINIGASYRFPELRRCYNKDCHVQINHAHGNRDYRSRVHPIYKKQNPHYGENYPTLLKYKGKNKKKLNPY